MFSFIFKEKSKCILISDLSEKQALTEETEKYRIELRDDLVTSLDRGRTEMNKNLDQFEYALTTPQALKRHREGIRYPTDQCEYPATTSENLKRLKVSRYSCDQCEYVSTPPQNLKLNKESKQEGVRQYCDQCDYAATRPQTLKEP